METPKSNAARSTVRKAAGEVARLPADNYQSDDGGGQYAQHQFAPFKSTVRPHRLARSVGGVAG
jgi:hypothetical protein